MDYLTGATGVEDYLAYSGFDGTVGDLKEVMAELGPGPS